MDNSEYDALVDEYIGDWQKQIAEGHPVTADQIAGTLDPDRDNSRARKWVLAFTDIKENELKRALQRERIKNALGFVPATPSALVEAVTKRDMIKAGFDGMLNRNSRPVLKMRDGSKWEVSEDEMSDRYIALECAIKCPSVLDVVTLERDINIINADLRIGFQRQDIGDAISKWLEAAKRERLHEICIDLDNGDGKRNGVDQMWTDIASRVFDCSENSPEFVVAVLKAFVWQVKRKILGLPVTGHLMPVILGPQNIGKSTFVNRFLSPLADLVLNMDFAMVSDDRNIEIWQHYVMFFDEMGHANRADVDAIKFIITADRLTRRPMRSNSKVTVLQNATLIGCSNKELGQLIKDPTGIRRFVGIRMRADNDRDLINATNWQWLWGSVKATDAHPMIGFEAELSDAQEEQRELGRVEHWMANFDFACPRYGQAVNSAGWIRAGDLYQSFRAYEDDNFAGAYKTPNTEWTFTMTNLLKNRPDAMIFERRRDNAGYSYRLTEAGKVKAGGEPGTRGRVVPFKSRD